MARQSSTSFLKLPHAAVADVSISLLNMERVCVKHAFRQVSAQLMRCQCGQCHLIGCHIALVLHDIPQSLNSS